MMEKLTAKKLAEQEKWRAESEKRRAEKEARERAKMKELQENH